MEGGDAAGVSRRVPVAQPVSPFGAAGVVVEGGRGEITTPALDHPITSGEWDELLRKWGKDPALFEVVEPVRSSVWEVQRKGGGIGTLYAYKAGIVSRRSRRISEADLAVLVRDVRRTKRRPPTSGGGNGLGVVLGDWQVGKGDGDGLEGTVRRLDRMIDQVGERLAWAVKHRGVSELGVFGVGDLGEGCTGWYPMQEHSIQADRREQVKIVRRMIRDALRAWSPLVPVVKVAAVGGNHGENRKDGAAFTSFADNDDVAVFEQVAEILGENPAAFGHITWSLPVGELTRTVDLAGLVVGLAHGHTARGGDLPKWWAGQIMGGQPVADAQLLLTGHFHHLRVQEVARGRDWIQVPAMDGGSTWWTETSGASASSGTVTFTVLPGPGGRRRWSDLMVLDPAE